MYECVLNYIRIYSMNYLAHLFLADSDDHYFMLGSLLGDFTTAITGDLYKKFDKSIADGIMHHRKVDSFTDSHLAYKRAKKILFDKHRHFSGIILDVLFDYFLIENWNSYSDMEYDVFACKAYKVMALDDVFLPLSYLRTRHYLIKDDVLREYKTLKGVQVTLNRINHRFKRKTTLAFAMKDIEININALRDSFDDFFPSLLNKHKI